MRAQEHVTLLGPRRLVKVFIAAAAVLFLTLIIVPMMRHWDEPVTAVLQVIAPLYLVGATCALWRRGITLDRLRRTVRVWQGPSFPLLWRTWPPDTFHTVSVSLERVDHHLARRRHPFDFEPRTTTHYPVRLQQDLDRESWDPCAPLPPVCTVESFGSYAEALAFAQEVAQLLGLKLRDDHVPEEREPSSLTPSLSQRERGR